MNRLAIILVTFITGLFIAAFFYSARNGAPPASAAPLPPATPVEIVILSMITIACGIPITKFYTTLFTKAGMSDFNWRLPALANELKQRHEVEATLAALTTEELQQGVGRIQSSEPEVAPGALRRAAFALQRGVSRLFGSPRAAPPKSPGGVFDSPSTPSTALPHSDHRAETPQNTGSASGLHGPRVDALEPIGPVGVNVETHRLGGQHSWRLAYTMQLLGKTAPGSKVGSDAPNPDVVSAREWHESSRSTTTEGTAAAVVSVAGNVE